jgi:phage terminase small subunit
MPRGGHVKSGPAVKDAATRALHGSRDRPQHRTKGDAGAAMIVCAPSPPGLSRAERGFWTYYAPLLAAEHRLTLKARDTLAKYCTALAVVADLRRRWGSRRAADRADRSATLKELRQWVLASRLYENDLILNPASAIRAPKVSGGEGPPAQGDALSDFDDDDAAVN